MIRWELFVSIRNAIFVDKNGNRSLDELWNNASEKEGIKLKINEIFKELFYYRKHHLNQTNVTLSNNNECNSITIGEVESCI